MSRYFLEVSYKGTNYSGFQTQDNANTIQYEVEKAFSILHRQPVSLTGSSRTDAGVHAFQNFFHFDFDENVHSQSIYKMNAILPDDIVLKNIYSMPDLAHSRFDATGREYIYRIHRQKNAFLKDASLYYPYRLNLELMKEASDYIKEQNQFYAFSKTNTQVRNFECRIEECFWKEEGEGLIFLIRGNRFLRGMVRLLVGTLLKVGREKETIEGLRNLFKGDKKSGFSVAAHGLYLNRVMYPENYFPHQ